MPSGLQCFDAAGNLTADIGNRYPRLLGALSVPVTYPIGTITHPAFATGDIWCTVASDSISTVTIYVDEIAKKIEYTPGPPIDSWTYAIIFYGVY